MDRFLSRGKRSLSIGEETKPKKSHVVNYKEEEQVNRDQEASTNGKQAQRFSELMDIDLDFPEINASALSLKKISRENLDLDYGILFPRRIADNLVRILEEEVDYFTGEMARLHVFGKWHDIPRKQATYGDPGLTYKYSGKVTPARPWPRSLGAIRDLVTRVTGYAFNFVLVNRYKDGNDKMGEHKDDEKELDSCTPIASVSLGQPRDFYFKHQDSKAPLKRNIDKVNMVLEHGSLLLMNSPTNKFWYHALPPRKSALGVRINLTFRKVLKK
ncbi:Alpha-ketoglutarate-dependent dioxygenase alkB 2 [Halocaridina rubra]|uniref:DNA oxidative demethylase ALKBH2 n=1 Tax=Halocaridina rubra TaxID=373956 RepID=A0AAN8ZRK8_HALRR